MTVIGTKNSSLAKKIKNKEYLLNAPLIPAVYFPTVSPILQDVIIMRTDQLTSKSSKVLSRLGPGKRVKVITKVNIMIQGQGNICLLVQIKVVKQFCFYILLYYDSTKGEVFVYEFDEDLLVMSSFIDFRLVSQESQLTKNFSIFYLQTSDLQNRIFMSRSRVLKAIPIKKQMMMGTTESFPTPKEAVMMILINVMNNPEIAVPTVNLETTSWERQLIMAKKVNWETLLNTPKRNAHINSKMNPPNVCFNAMETIRMAPKDTLIPMLPAIIRFTYLNFLLIIWQVEPTTIQPIKRGIDRQVQMLQSLKEFWKQSNAASTTFQPSRELIPLMRNINTVVPVSYINIISIQSKRILIQQKKYQLALQFRINPLIFYQAKIQQSIVNTVLPFGLTSYSCHSSYYMEIYLLKGSIKQRLYITIKSNYNFIQGFITIQSRPFLYILIDPSQ